MATDSCGAFFDYQDFAEWCEDVAPRIASEITLPTSKQYITWQFCDDYGDGNADSNSDSPAFISIVRDALLKNWDRIDPDKQLIIGEMFSVKVTEVPCINTSSATTEKETTMTNTTTSATSTTKATRPYISKKTAELVALINQGDKDAGIEIHARVAKRVQTGKKVFPELEQALQVAVSKGFCQDISLTPEQKTKPRTAQPEAQPKGNEDMVAKLEAMTPEERKEAMKQQLAVAIGVAKANGVTIEELTQMIMA